MTKLQPLVFTDRERTDTSPSAHSEPTFTFLDRVAGPYWDQVRALLERWVARFPEEARADVVARLRSPDFAQHASAYWEVHLHETFVQSGFEVAVHPTVPDSARQPDFLVSRDDEAFYVEAKCVFPGGEDPGRSARTKKLYDMLDSIECPNFFLQIDVNQVGPADIATKALRRKLETWVSALDPDDLTLHGQYFELGERFVWSDAGWELELRPIPVSPDGRGRAGHRPLGIFGPAEAAWISDGETLRTALREKGSAYGELDRPLVIALNSFMFSADDFDTMNALYGTQQLTISLADRDAPPVPSRKPDGYWARRSWAHRHVSGVLIGRSIAEYRPTAAATFWVHPQPDDAVSALPVWRVAQPAVDHIEYVEPEASLSELFGLPENWPIGEPFPHD